MQVSCTLVPGQKNFKHVYYLDELEDSYLGTKGKRMNVAPLLRSMDDEIFSEFRETLDSSDTEHYVLIDFQIH